MEKTLWVNKESGLRFMLLDVKIVDDKTMVVGDDEYSNELKIIPIDEFNEKYERFLYRKPAPRVVYEKPAHSALIETGDFVNSMIWGG